MGGIHPWVVKEFWGSGWYTDMVVKEFWGSGRYTYMGCKGVLGKWEVYIHGL